MNFLQENLIYSIPALGLVGIIVMMIKSAWVNKQDAGDKNMQELAGYIADGAMAFLKAEWRVLSIFAVFTAALLAYSGTITEIKGVPMHSSWIISISFLIGAIFSATAGYIGMKSATKANVRTTQAARTSLKQALKVSFTGGTVMGLGVAGLAILGLGGLFIVFLKYFNVVSVNSVEMKTAIEVLTGFSLGAESIALFARVGGGIYTKAADVGADLVGKVEAGIPEDDPRNPAVIADNVGDNVGDCAGMAADLFETYAVTIVATMVLASIIFTGTEIAAPMMMYPLAIGAVCIITSIIGTFFVRLGSSQNIMGALYKGFIVSAVLSAVAIWPVTDYVIGMGPIGDDGLTGQNLFWCGIAGLVVTGLLVWITEYYTSTEYRPVRSVAQSSTTGHGTNVIQGLAIGMESCAIPALIICGGIIFTYAMGGLLGIAVAVTAMLALAGMVVALDAYGPVTDNAGGIAEMAELEDSVRDTTDALDAVGNTTKAVTKGYAIGSAGLGALVLFAAYTQDLAFFAAAPETFTYFAGVEVNFDLSNPYVVVGLIFGGLLPFLSGAMSMTAVGRAAGSVVEEVRRQFQENKGIMEGTARPDYSKTVDLLTKSAIAEMIVPSLLPVLAPIVLYFVIYGLSGDKGAALAAVGAMLLGVIVTGLYVAISMTVGGGAWDNAKKYIEDGNHGGKGSEAHKAAVTGDTVGDPYKDTAGPAVNPMIKITNIMALLLLAVLAH